MDQAPPTHAVPVQDALEMSHPERTTFPSMRSLPEAGNGTSRLSAVAVDGTVATEGTDGSCGDVEHELGVLMHGTSTPVVDDDLLPAVLREAVQLLWSAARFGQPLQFWLVPAPSSRAAS